MLGPISGKAFKFKSTLSHFTHKKIKISRGVESSSKLYNGMDYLCTCYTFPKKNLTTNCP